MTQQNTAQSSQSDALELDRCDPIWTQVRSEAETIQANEPIIAGLAFATILNHNSLDHAICYRLAQLLGAPDVASGLLLRAFEEVIEEQPRLGEAFRRDLVAVLDRDPACDRFIQPLLYFKGFHALQSYRLANALWNKGKTDFALYLQSLASRLFSIDIHPAAQIGTGLFVDHGHAIVIGETAVVGNNVSILHNVTLGGTGKETGDRHPKIENCVLIGSGAKILGNITVGKCSRIAAGSVVLQDVPPRSTVAGVPAKIIGEAGCTEPSRTMNHMLEAYEELWSE